MDHQQSVEATSDKDDIINSFEDDTFLTKYSRYNKNSAATLLSQLDDFLLWLNGDFLSTILSELPNFTNQEVKDCLDKIRMIQQTSTSLYQKTERNKSKNNLGFNYTCSKCNAVIQINANHSVSIALQQHEHIEAALANSHVAKEEGAPISLLQTKLLNYCETCKTILNIPTGFKFNFNISYHPDVEMFLYMQNFNNDVVTVDNLNLFAMQLKNSNLSVCLLCVCEFAIHLGRDHIRGRRHEKSKMSPARVDIFLAYHKNWLKQEASYQAHQVYFNPFSIESTNCIFCDNLLVPYRLLQEHINSNSHKEKVLKVENKNALIELQKLVYHDQGSIRNETINAREMIVSLDEPSTSNSHVQEQSESENSDDEPFLDESDDTSTGTQEEPKNSKETVKTHNIIQSFTPNATVELESLVEHRFLAHFDKIMRINGQKVECQFCVMLIDKNRNSILQHITSNNHRRCGIDQKKRYLFHCEICNIWIRFERVWLLHLKNDKHKSRCQKLGESRKKRLMEYECETCKHIIFGDDISIQRHRMMSNRDRKRKSNKVVLDKRTTDLFTKEDALVNEAKKLVKDAEDVLLNQANINECCNAIKEVLMESYPNCNVHPFGSQVSGLGSKKSDLDLFVDLGDMYLGEKSQDSTSQVKIVSNVMKIFLKRKGDFTHLNPIPRARTPIIQLYHVKTRLDCDLSFRHGLSVENTKFLRLCIEAQPCTQYLILLLKQWLDYGKLAYRHISTYSLSMMVIFYLQMNKYLLSVDNLHQLSTESHLIIDGWSIMDLSSVTVEKLKTKIQLCNKSIKAMLTDFFLFYKNFNYTSEIICPLLGRPVKKALFIKSPQGLELPEEMSIYVQKVALNTTELFKAQSAMCIQDPFDLSHNLTKSCSNSVVERFKKLCDLSYQLLMNN